MSQRTQQVRPNARYDAVFGTAYADDDEAETDDIVDETETERNVLSELEENTPDYHDHDRDVDETLTWDMVSVSTDAALLDEITRYFTGVDVDEDVDTQREKLASGDVEWYINVQMVVRRAVGRVEYGPDGDSLACDNCNTTITGWESEFTRSGFARSGGDKWKDSYINDSEDVVCSDCILSRIREASEVPR